MLRYTDCGLTNVWLENGYEVRQTPYGEALAVFDVEELHRAIARDLVRRPKRLSGAEFRFLRKELEFSQKRLAAVIGADVQAVARWEKGKVRVPKMADRFIRAIYRECDEGNAHILNIVDRLNEFDEREHNELRFAHAKGDWVPASAAA